MNKADLAAAERALNQGRFAEATSLAREAVAQNPQQADAHFLFAMAVAGEGQITLALTAVDNALALKKSAEYFAQRARLLSLLRRDAEAMAAAEQALQCNPQDSLTLDTTGCVYSRLGKHELAVPLFERAVKMKPEHPQFQFNLAASLGFLGRFDEAEQQYEALISAAPSFVKAHTALSALRKQTIEVNHIDRLKLLLAEKKKSREQLHIRYALAKEYEDIGEWDLAFEQLQVANSQHKKRLGYDFARDEEIFKDLEQCFARENYFNGEGLADKAPIFIIGMPRSGTTLVDRILSSHRDVTSAGELQLLPRGLKRLAATPSPVALDADTITAAASLVPRSLGALYLEGAAALRQPSPRFIDKLPLNFLYAGYIARSLPNAAMICLRRDPMDTVWSNYKHLFAAHFSYYNYSYDLMDCARYVSLFNRLVKFWNNSFPGRILDVNYETLVGDTEASIRSILAHCGLEWDENCLAFHQNPAAVSTPSAAQVRQPIYKSSIGKWRRYEKYLGDVKAYLQTQNI